MQESGLLIRNEEYNLLTKADIIDEASDTLYYMGFVGVGAAVNFDEANCYIVKFEKTGNIWTKTYANGNRQKDKKFSLRTSYTYTFLK